MLSRKAPLLAAAAASGSASASEPHEGGSSSVAASLARLCQQLTSLFPLWVVLAAISGFFYPPLYLWFSDRAITWGLMFVMLGMGLTLTVDEILGVFTRRPQLLLLGMVLQYTVLPAIGFVISRFWGLSPGLSAGVALVSCMPGGTASNIVAYIAKADMPLSIMMTTASTLMAIFTTPLLTQLLVGSLVPVDPKDMFLSVLQLVLAPVLVGTALNSAFPAAVRRVRPFMPFVATAIVVLIVGSMIGSNAAVVAQSGVHIISAVFLLHGCGFGLGYGVSRAMGLSDRICRTNSIEVGMQSSALAAVLAKLHFADPIVVAPCVLSACTHATMGSLLAGYWQRTVKDEEEPALA